MRKSMIVGNWKMNGTRNFVDNLLQELIAGSSLITHVELVVCPPFVFLDQAKQLLQNTAIALGAQNTYPADMGAFTGEISPQMLKELSCQYVIVGHSERRHLMGESNEFVANKFIYAGQQGLKPILCVGETQDEREKSQTFKVISDQLNAVLMQDSGPRVLAQGAIIAYEPVWAIGTGLTATPEQAQEVHHFIRQEVEKINKPLAEKVRILYGGSVKENNAHALFSMPDIDGGLIGGAALNAKEFLEIAKLCH